MRPVDQTRFGAGEGDCFAACLASLLELSIEQVPNFCADTSGEDTEWFTHVRAWLRGFRLTAVCMHGPPHPRQLADTFSIVCGSSARGLRHATIWLGSSLVHDPHPSRAGLVEVEDTTVLVPLDVSRWLSAGAR